METFEREFKLRIASEQQLHALIRHLGGASAPPVLQVNHFFDTAERALHAEHFSLRLRAESGVFTLTLKGPQQPGPGSLAVRPEEELEVPAAEAGRILDGTRSALQLLRTARAETALHRRASAMVGTKPLRRLGSFQNERLRLGPLRFPPDSAGPELIFELDRTHLPDGTIARELELELPAGVAPAPVAAALERLLSDLGIPLESAPSKAALFFRILDELRPVPGPTNL